MSLLYFVVCAHCSFELKLYLKQYSVDQSCCLKLFEVSLTKGHELRI